MVKLTKQQIKNELWRRGDLTWKMHPLQKEMYEIFQNAAPRSQLVWLLSRQSGKSFLMTLMALMECIKTPHSIVKMLTDTKAHLESIYEPLFTEILLDCPDDVKPVYYKKSYKYVFPNGSEIQLAGSDKGHAEKLRGQKAVLILVDEAGFCDRLRYNVRSILFPLLTHTNGKIILASTPPLDADHDFHFFIEQADINGHLYKKTIYDNPLLTKEVIESIIQEQGGINSEDFRREYLVEIIRSEDNIVFPEYTDDLEAEIVKEWPKPPYYDAYIGMDLGYKDLTAVLFCYYDYRADKIIIEDELVLPGKELLIPDLAKRMLEKERELWTNPLTGELNNPFLRVSDINYLVTEELKRTSNYALNFIPAEKYDNEGAIHNLRVLLANKKIIINPKCVFLRRHLKHCKWKDKNTKSTFARSADDGHYDAVDALKYIVKKIIYTKNPYPPGYDLKLKGYNSSDLYKNPHSTQQNQIDVLGAIFGKKKGY